MKRTLREKRAKWAQVHRDWYRKNAKGKSNVRFFPFGTDWAATAESMTVAEREFYKVHIGKSRKIKILIGITQEMSRKEVI